MVRVGKASALTATAALRRRGARGAHRRLVPDPSVGASFPGNDYGLIRNDGGLAQPGNVNLYNGSFQDITGAGNPTPGMQICKSGSTTGMGGGFSYFQPVVPGLNMFGVNVF